MLTAISAKLLGKPVQHVKLKQSHLQFLMGSGISARDGR